MAIIKKYNKQNGTTYVYESVSYWDKEKKQPRSKRKLIGKIDDATGEIIPTSGRSRRSNSKNTTSESEILVEEIASPASPSTSSDYKLLYSEAQKQLLEKDAVIAGLNASVSQLKREQKELLLKLDLLVREYQH